MFSKIKKIRFLVSVLFLSFFFLLVNCSGNGESSIYTAPNALAVDSTNDRLFVFQSGGEIFSFTASTYEEIGNQPIVSEDEDETTSALLPSVVYHAVAYATGTTTRLFVFGGFDDDSGNLVFNRVRVLDFDGSAFTEASFSPLILSDGDDATDESDDSFAAALIDQTNSTLYITDATTGMLFAISAEDGTTVSGPTAIAGNPQGMALDNGYLYICNSSTEVGEGVVSVIKLEDFTTTTIDLSAPCSLISVKSNATETIMMIKRSDAGDVFIERVDTTTYAAVTPVTSASSDYSNGLLAPAAGITSVIGDIRLANTSDGTLVAYLAELDGNIEYVTIDSSEGTYSIEALSTSATNIGHGAVLQATDGSDSQIFFAAESGGVIVIEAGTTSVDVHD